MFRIELRYQPVIALSYPYYVRRSQDSLSRSVSTVNYELAQKASFPYIPTESRQCQFLERTGIVVVLPPLGKMVDSR